MVAAAAQRKFWGWGVEGEGPTRAQQEKMGRSIAARFGTEVRAPIEPPTIGEIELRAPRVSPPDSLAHLCTTDPEERAGHTYGKSFRDVWRGLHRDFSQPPDAVAIPRDEADIVALLDWCSDTRVAAIPYGGGSSVVGGVECDVDDAYRGAISVDLRALDRVIEVDRTSRAARVQAGVYGPALEDQLRPHGLTLRHFPQSFEFSTLGGWLATRSGGHYATLHTHIDDFVESIRAVTPRGVWESRRLPGSGAGPSPDRMLLGSEGTLGVITEAWMRLQDRPTHRASATARFSTFTGGIEAAQAIAQSGLHPANCRLLDPIEAQLTGTDDRGDTLLLLAFESADHPLDAWIARAVECALDYGARIDDDAVVVRSGETTGAREGAAGSWRNAFVRAPYTRDAIVALGMISETFETACTWDRFETLHETVTGAVLDTAQAAGAWPAAVTCRFTHVYPDGPAPYFTVLAAGVEGEQLAQWEAIKAAAGDAIIRSGGTITHHHAVGRDHRRWYDRQRPEPFAEALRAAKRAIDPSAILNPGVLVDPVNDSTGGGSYEAVVFDLGGVVFPSPFEAFDRYDVHAELAPGSVRALIKTSSETGAWAALERGELTMSEFYAQLEAEAVAAEFVLDAARLMGMVASGFGPRPAMQRAIARIRESGLRTAALTNNWPRADDSAGGVPSPNGHMLGFDVIIESAVVGLRKPDPRIYELVLTELEVDAAATVFLDDLGINLKPAREMGMTTIKVTDPDVALAELSATLGFEVH